MALPRIQPAGDSAVLVTFGDQIDARANQSAHGLAHALAGSPLAGAGEAVPGYATLLVHYDPGILTYRQVEDWVRDNLSVADSSPVAPRRVEIPVMYGGEFGPDLGFVASHTGLSQAQVVEIHCSREYTVCMMGFTPGFPYLGGMDPAIAAPRLDTPRSLVPGGSVGIAGAQTGIYPLDSPGGWRIIGRTLLRLFDINRQPPFLLAPGDRVRFVPREAR